MAEGLSDKVTVLDVETEAERDSVTDMVGLAINVTV